MICLARECAERLAQGARLWLFLDYDGTLAEFAPTPDDILPDPDLIALIGRLVNFPEVLRVVILSGRRIDHIEKLLPVPGLLLAGTYGIEYKTFEGERVNLLDFEKARPFLDQVKQQWVGLIDDQKGFYLEDKGYAIALHASNASEKDAREVITEASRCASDVVGKGMFRVEGGIKFLEVAPTIADKGQSIGTLVKRFPWQNASMIYFGDDDKDESAFQVVTMYEGDAVLVSKEPRSSTYAQHRLESTIAVRAWLQKLADDLIALGIGESQELSDRPDGLALDQPGV